MRLTDITIEALKPPSRGSQYYWERPLGVRVTANGVKSYVVLLRPGQRKTISRVGSVSLKEARTMALRLKAEQHPNKYQAQPVTVSEARATYLAAIDVRPATRLYYVAYLAKLRDMPLQDVDHRHILHILDQAPKGSTALHLRTYSAFFRWCIPRWLKYSPTTGLKVPRGDARSRVLTDNEIARVWTALTADNLPSPFRDIVRLLICLGCRRNEVASLRRSWISDNRITWPAEAMKNKQSHWLPLMPTAKSIISSIPNTGDLLFPARNTAPFYSTWSHPTKQLASSGESVGVESSAVV
jgi:integrase